MSIDTHNDDPASQLVVEGAPYPPIWPREPFAAIEAAEAANPDAAIWPLAEAAAEHDAPLPLRVVQGIGNAALVGLVAFELSPLNEISRIAAAGAVGTLTGSPELAAATFAVSSLAVEGIGALATAHLLETRHGDWVIRRANKLLGGLAGREIQTNGLVDFGVAMIAGVPAALVIKQTLDPSRTARDNVRDGLRLTLTTSTVLGGEAYAVARGIAKAGSLPVIAGVVSVGAGVVLGSRRFIQERLLGTSPFAYGEYEGMAQKAGPQLDGYQEVDYRAVLDDSTTRMLRVHAGKHRGLWPVLSDIRHNTEYVPGYFDAHEGTNSAATYYLSLPPREALADTKVQRRLADMIYDVLQAGGTMVMDQLMDQEDSLTFVQGILHARHPELAADALQVDGFIDPSNGTPAEVAHFQGLAAAIEDVGEPIDPHYDVIGAMRAEYHRLIEAGELDSAHPSRTVVVDPEDLDRPLNGTDGPTVLERLWEIYNGRFEPLLENYPVRGEQTFEEFADLVRKASTLVVAQVSDGNISAFTYIADVKNCEWLNPQYYAEQYPNKPTMYFPGIASDKNAEGRTALRLIKLMGQLMTSTVGRVRIVWQCTNVSKAYVPNIVRAGIELSGNMKLAEPISQSASYRYFGLRLAQPGKQEK